MIREALLLPTVAVQVAHRLSVVRRMFLRLGGACSTIDTIVIKENIVSTLYLGNNDLINTISCDMILLRRIQFKGVI